jgi:hypothetical protein
MSNIFKPKACLALHPQSRNQTILQIASLLSTSFISSKHQLSATRCVDSLSLGFRFTLVNMTALDIDTDIEPTPLKRRRQLLVRHVHHVKHYKLFLSFLVYSLRLLLGRIRARQGSSRRMLMSSTSSDGGGVSTFLPVQANRKARSAF